MKEWTPRSYSVIKPGVRFGRFTAVNRIQIQNGGTVRWECKCDCGSTKTVGSANLTSGASKSCGCLKSELMRNKAVQPIIGKKFNLLTVIRQDPMSKPRKPKVICVCDCGVEKSIYSAFIKNGRTKSCGCLTRRRGPDNPKWKGGKRFSNGYVDVAYPDSKGGRKAEHILLMEAHMGRKLFKGETVHHKNGIRHDNEISNLELWSKNHPSGQRVSDMIDFCCKYLGIYAPEKLSSHLPADQPLIPFAY